MQKNNIQFKKEPYTRAGGVPVFIDQSSYGQMGGSLQIGVINKLKRYFKNFSGIYRFLFYVVSPAYFFGKSEKAFIKSLPANALVVEIGSGDRRLTDSITNVDVYPWKGVDVVADACDLPFVDDTVDAVVSSWVIEHLPDPARAIAEMERILVKGGKFYLATNFIFPYHPSPVDYYRWSKSGLEILLKDFTIVEIAPAVGPTSALLSVFQEWFSIAFSFNMHHLKDILWIIAVILTFPIKYLDIIFGRFSTAHTIAAGFYVIGIKK